MPPASTSEPLLGGNDSLGAATPSPTTTLFTKLVRAWANLATGAIGVGVLSFAFAFKSAGLGQTLVMMFAFALLNSLTLYSMLLGGEYTLAKTRSAPASYEQVVLTVLGRKSHALATLLVLINQFGQMVSCLVIIGDLGVPLMSQTLHWPSTDSNKSARALLAACFLLIVSPLFLVYHF